MLRIGICEDLSDHQDCLDCLRRSLEKLLSTCREIIHITTYSSGQHLLMELEGSSQEFSLLFLDIIMDGLTGMETARTLREQGRNIPIVFLSSSPDFAVESYDVEAVGYLLKPLQESKLKRLLERVLDPPDVPRVCIRSGRQHRYLPMDKIIFAESDNHSIRIHLNGGEVVTSHEKLGDLAIRMDDRFLRCHQTFL